MNNVTFSFCHLYPMHRFLLFCHSKRFSYVLDFTIEEHLNYIFTEKISQCLLSLDTDLKLPKAQMSRVNTFSTTQFLTNSYSVPVQYIGRMIGIKGYPETIEIYYKRALIAVHTRCYGKHQSVYHLEHYMPLLQERRRAIVNAAPVKQNVSPEILDELRKNSNKYSRTVYILQDFVNKEKPKLHDLVKILSVDLRQYNQLSRRENLKG